MKKLRLFLLTLSLLSAVSFFSVHAAAPANPPYHLTTVSWVVSTKDNMDVDDRYVTLIGHITGTAGNGDYIFTDGTGTIYLDGGDHALPINQKIVVGGRIDQAYFGWGHLEIDVQRWHAAKTL
jgi:uncharacterized protein YdeI (BOF family)